MYLKHFWRQLAKLAPLVGEIISQNKNNYHQRSFRKSHYTAIITTVRVSTRRNFNGLSTSPTKNLILLPSYSLPLIWGLQLQPNRGNGGPVCFHRDQTPREFRPRNLLWEGEKSPPQSKCKLPALTSHWKQALFRSMSGYVSCVLIYPGSRRGHGLTTQTLHTEYLVTQDISWLFHYNHLTAKFKLIGVQLTKKVSFLFKR